MHPSINRILGLGFVAIALLSPIEVWAHGAGGHGSSDSNNTPKQTTSQPSQPRRDVVTTSFADRSMQPPHGGQITATKHHYFEVVYTPSDTRLYIYNASQRGINARFVKGEVSMTVHSSGQSLRFPLEVVAQPAFTGDLGYLAVKVDVSRVRDGDMDLRFDLKKLLPEEPEASFEQVFFLTRPPMPVTLAGLSAADRQPVAQQAICPVTETPLGDHGDPIKLVVNNQPVYVCCQGCIQPVQNDPHGYLQKTSNLVQVNSAARRPGPPAPQRPSVALAQLTADDRPLVQRQGMCPVMDEPLGGHGTPIKLLVDGRPLYVCCEGCVEQVEQNPYFFLDKVAGNARGAQQVSRRPAVSVSTAMAADVPAVRAQGVCPVMDEPLGDHGAPLKVTVDGRTMFVCCQSCVSDVVANFEANAQKLAARRPVNSPAAHDHAAHDHASHDHAEHNHAPEPTRQPPSHSPPPAYAGSAGQLPASTVVVSETTAADDAAIRAQGNCPVMKQPLGAHGKPIKLLIDGQPLFVCCKGCIYKVQKDPTSYVSHVVYKQPLDRNVGQDAWFYRQPAPSGSGAGGSCCSSGKGASCH
ncbi:MAG: hypothetical protein O3C40_30120 [Planctomycetota bacterium]|nr:hypothetical protein [Planctomycetota bacterium]